MRRALLLAVPLLLLLATSAEARPGSWCEQTGADGTKQDWTCQWGPVKVTGYQVRQDVELDAPKPPVDGAITNMDVDVTDADGTPVSVKRLMLHHIVFLNFGRRFGDKQDATCGTFTMWDSRSTLPALGERFYAAGEERARFAVPPGYGYRVGADERWGLTWMVMNHRATNDAAYIRYRVTVDTAPDLTPVTPYWLDVANCSTDPVYDVPGGGRPGSSNTRSATFTMPRPGRIVAAAGHVHGGAKQLRVAEPGCGDRTLFTSTPAWAPASGDFYTVRPILHEPGPLGMSMTLSQQGFPVAAGEKLRLDSIYDAQRAHTRVMGISVLLVAADDTVAQPCGALPTDVQSVQTDAPHRTAAPVFTVPLTGRDAAGRAITISRPPGRTTRGGGTVTVGDDFFSRRNIVLRAGQSLKYVFPSKLQLHNVTVASGPRGWSSPNLDAGRSFTVRFTRRGTYRIFCALHPVAMTERVVVR